MKRVIFTVFLIVTYLILNSKIVTAATISGTYSAGDIPTDNAFNATCNGAATPLNINLPAGGPWMVTGIDVAYNMTAQGGAWMSEQRSQIFCQNTTTLETGAPFSGAGTSAGTQAYNRTNLNIANGVYPGGTSLGFELQAFRTWGTAPAGCNTNYQIINNNTWTITVTYVAALPMTYTSSTCTQVNTSNVEVCASDQEIVGVEIVTNGALTPIDLTQLIVRTDGSSAPLADITNIDVYYTGSNSTFSISNHFGNAAPLATGNNIIINGTQTLEEGTNYFWITYDLNHAGTAGNNVDVRCNNLTVNAVPRTPTVQNPAGNRTLIDCGRTCPTNATIFSDGFEGGPPVQGVITGTTYGSHWTGLPRTGSGHAWMNIVDGLSNLDVYERRFDGYYMGCDVTFDYWTLHNSIGFDADYILVDDNNNIIDFNNVLTTAVDVNVYQNRSITFTPTTTGITLRIHCNSIGGPGNDIALDDFTITQCCPAVLPVELIAFEAECDNSNVVLNWSTATEINNSHFIIEKSIDMNTFKEIGVIEGNGNSSTQLTYQWIDYNAFNSSNYYRLKQIDFDGTIKILETVSSKCSEHKSITVYPNPTTKNITVNLGEAHQNISIEIKNVVGQTIQFNKYESAEYAELSINGEAGIYFITIFNNLNESIHHQKIVKQ
ncbi:MAG: BNR-repeat neuraminidase N-terminal domain-containing protein [Vicingaceae bacterium]